MSTAPVGRHFVPPVPDPRYADRKQYSMLVGANDLDGFEIGEYAIFVRYENEALISGQIVHVTTEKSLIEVWKRTAFGA